MPTFVTVVPLEIEGEWREAGYEIDTTGYRQGAIAQMIEDGLIAAESGGGGGAAPVFLSAPMNKAVDTDLDPVFEPAV